MPIFFDGKSDKKMRRGDTAMELEYRFAMSDGIENLMQNLLEITFSSLSASDWQL
jgi:hypothetical protein